MGTRRNLLCALGALGLALLLAGCGVFSHSVDADAANYYDYMLGMAPKTKYTNFYSPAYVRSLPPHTVDQINKAMGRSSKANPTHKPVSRQNIRSSVQGRFALTTVSSQAGFALHSLGTTKWVRDGTRWYLYTGNDAEVKAYGTFPGQLQIPPEAQAGSAPQDASADDMH